jgi:L-alanine-DL-glutamate epimerase-like enolase superfamily enzyme
MHQLLREDIVASPDLTPVNGTIGAFAEPGLGVELDRDAVARAAERYAKGAPS